MIDALRPSTLGEILDRTAETYRARFLVFVGIAWIPAALVLASALAAFLSLAWMGTEARTTDPATVALFMLLFLAAFGLVLLPLSAAAAGLGAGALNHAALAAFYGDKVTIRAAYKAAWNRGWRYLWIFLLEALFIFVAPAMLGSILIAVFAISQGLMRGTPDQAGATLAGMTLLIVLALSVYGVWMLLMLCLSFRASVAEDAPAWTAIKRAIALSKGTRGRILVLYILGIVLRWGLSFLLTIPFILVVAFVPGVDTPQHDRILTTVFLLVLYCGSFAVRAFTTPVYAIAQLHFYFDQRIRREGFDIEWMMRQAGLVEVRPPAPEAAPWMPPASATPNVRPAAEPIAAPAAPFSLQSPAAASMDTVEPPPPAGEPA